MICLPGGAFIIEGKKADDKCKVMMVMMRTTSLTDSLLTRSQYYYLTTLLCTINLPCNPKPQPAQANQLSQPGEACLPSGWITDRGDFRA